MIFLGDSDGEVSDKEEEEECNKQSLFFYTDDSEDEDVVIRDEPILNEEGEGSEEFNELIECDDIKIFLVERNSYLTSNNLEIEMEE